MVAGQDKINNYVNFKLELHKSLEIHISLARIRVRIRILWQHPVAKQIVITQGYSVTSFRNEIIFLKDMLDLFMNRKRFLI